MSLVEVVRELPPRLRRRCDGLSPTALRATLAAMGVPRDIRRAAPPPSMMGLSPWMPDLGNPYPPPTFYLNCWQWLTPDNVTTTGSTITGITDMSGSGHHATAVLGMTTTTWPNGHAGIAVANTGSPGAKTAANVAPNVFASATVFAVLQPTSLNDYYGVYDHDYVASWSLILNASTSQWKWVSANPSSPYGLCEAGDSTFGSPVVGHPTILVATDVADLYVYYSGGVAHGSFSTGQNPRTSSTASFPVNFFGRNDTGAATGMGALVGDGAIFTRNLAGSEITALVRYFGVKYGIAVP